MTTTLIAMTPEEATRLLACCAKPKRAGDLILMATLAAPTEQATVDTQTGTTKGGGRVEKSTSSSPEDPHLTPSLSGDISATFFQGGPHDIV